MKTLSFFALTLVLLAAGCASPCGQPRATAPAAIASASAHFLIISAVYGSGTQFADVTDRVDDLLHQPSVEFFARPEWLHADPTPGWNKALVIVYEFKGQRRTFTTGEGGKVSLGELTTQANGKSKRAKPKAAVKPKPVVPE